jgi:hypothetical protein
MICGFVLKALYSGLSPETTASLSSVNDLARSFKAAAAINTASAVLIASPGRQHGYCIDW